MKFNKWFLGIACVGAIMLSAAARAQTNTAIVSTNASGGLTTIIPAGVTQFGTDAYNSFKQFSITNPISVGVFGVKNGSLYGVGLEANTVNTNTAVNVGFAFLGVQTESTAIVNGISKTTKGWDFFDASLNLSVSQVETIPVINLPITLRIFSGPFASLSGGVLMGEQSGTTGDLNFNLFGGNIDFGAGLINDSGAAAAKLKSVLPMAHVNFTWRF